MIRSLLEGVTFGMRDSLEIIQGMGVPIREIRVSGGGARSRFWRQMQADVFGQTVKPSTPRKAPRSAPRYWPASAPAPSKTSAKRATPASASTQRHAPKPQAVRLYNRNYPMFQKLYRSLEADFAEDSPDFLSALKTPVRTS